MDIVAVFMTVVILHPLCLGQDVNSWTRAMSLNTARQEVAVTELNGHIYVFGGFVNDLEVTDSVEVYDPKTDSWTYTTPMPIGLHHTTATSVNNKIYIIGGWTDFFETELDIVFEYDPATTNWTQKASLPSPRGAPAATVIDSRIYVCGGWPPERSRDLTVYDPETDEWRIFPPMPTGRNHLGAANIDGKLYAVGGRSDLDPPRENVANVEMFDPLSGQWTVLTPLPQPRSGIAVVSIGRYVLAFGGEANPANQPIGTFRDATAYDTTQDVWFKLADMPLGLHGISATVVNGSVHIPGGAPVQEYGITNAHFVYQF